MPRHRASTGMRSVTGRFNECLQFRCKLRKLSAPVLGLATVCRPIFLVVAAGWVAISRIWLLSMHSDQPKPHPRSPPPPLGLLWPGTAWSVATVRSMLMLSLRWPRTVRTSSTRKALSSIASSWETLLFFTA